jgi:hypothetical protein
MAAPADFTAITTAVLTLTTDSTVVVAMLVGAGLESGWNESAGGGGAWQIIDAARPKASVLTGSQLQLDAAYMAPRYIAAASANTETESADKYADIAYVAERPAMKYQLSQGEARVQSVYSTVLQNYGQGGSGATGQGQVLSTGPLSGAENAAAGAGAVLDWITTPANWVRIAEVALGGVIIVIALHALVSSGSVSSSTKHVGGLAKDAATAAIFA